MRIQIMVMITIMSSIALSAIEPKVVFKDELKSVLNSELPMSKRWFAVMNSFSSAEKNEINQLSVLFEHKEWFIRNAALVAADRKDQNLAIAKASLLIKDRALVVRSAAAEILIRANSSETRKILISEMNQPYNFRGRQSLWIRNQMMNYLILDAKSTDRDFYVQHLFDRDSKIGYLSTIALETITLEKTETKDEIKKILEWQKKVKEKKWL